MNLDKSGAGIILCGDSFSKEISHEIDALLGHTPGDKGWPKSQFPLVICDPWYGGIVGKKDEADYLRWMRECEVRTTPSATICMFGGIGKRGNRPFLHFAYIVEEAFPEWQIKNWITWGKKRAYGVQDNYLWTREECLILTKGEPVFNIPYLEEKRGYAGFNKKYPAKSEYLRRTNVWTDITELFRGKIHECQKPDKLYQVLIETHSNPGDMVYDPCGGSLTTVRAAKACQRRYCVVEKDAASIEKAGYKVEGNAEQTNA